MTSAPATEARIDGLMSRMSLEEKMRQLAFGPNANSRLGIPMLNSGEVLHGVCAPGATSFPQAIAFGATWDPDLIERVATVIAREARALGIHIVFAPMLGLGRDPRWGRIEESYGEDPYLVSAIACAYVHGLQGRGARRFDREHLIAAAKHFVADGEPARGMNGAPVDISMHSLRELHMKPFEDVVRKARVGGIMPAHHAVNRDPCHGSCWLLRDVLRGEWGFDGIIVSDCIDIPKLWACVEEGYTELHFQHRVARNVPEAGALALRAGIAMELGFDWDQRSYGKGLFADIRAGKVPDGEALVDEACRRVLRTKLMLGLFDEGKPISEKEDPLFSSTATGMVDGKEEYAQRIAEGQVPIEARTAVNPEEVLRRPEHDALALECARKAIVLLKNEGPLLPLDPARLKRIAVIGPNATDPVLGGYSTGTPKHYVSLLDGIRAACPASVHIVHARGCNISKKGQTPPPGVWTNPVDLDESQIPAAVEAARGADVAIVAVGTNRDVLGENTDVDDIGLTPPQSRLVREVHATGTPVVLVLLHGAPQSILWESQNIPAIVDGFYLGQETGRALADVLFGKVCPGGKLPAAVPRCTGQIPVLYNALWWAGVKMYNGNGQPVTPIYPFGYGLSYTKFEIGAPTMDRPAMKPNGEATVRATVRNVGNREGDEVVQMYITDDYASIVRPARELKGFRRVTLKPGAQETVEFRITSEELKFWKSGGWVVEPGTFQVWVGNCCTCTARAQLTVEG